jgi:hypothetical protein
MQLSAPSRVESTMPPRAPSLAHRLLLAAACSLTLGAGCFPDASHPEAEQPEQPLERAVEPPPITPVPLIEAAPVPEPEPAPAPFAGRTSVRVDELLAALADEVPRLAEAEAILADYQRFLTDFALEHDEELYLDYVRVKIAFEATRAGGWWGLHWKITNQQPNSAKIWATWRALGFDDPAPERADELSLPLITAHAECDELSALFAFVARRLGLSRRSEVGLFWPTGNHVVAVWTLRHGAGDKPVRVVVPTSQIFLSDAESLGTRGFNPWRQKTIFDYRRQDAAKDLLLPGPLASAFVQAVREHGHLSQLELQGARNVREERQSWSLAEDYGRP